MKRGRWGRWEGGVDAVVTGGVEVAVMGDAVEADHVLVSFELHERGLLHAQA